MASEVNQLAALTQILRLPPFVAVSFGQTSQQTDLSYRSLAEHVVQALIIVALMIDPSRSLRHTKILKSRVLAP